MTVGNGNGNGSGRPGDVVISAQAADLDRLARKLGLSDGQQRFALHLVADPVAGVKAAATRAGSKNPDVIGRRWKAMPKVKAYIKAVEEVAAGAPIVPPPVVYHRDPDSITLTPEVVTGGYSVASYEIDTAIASREEVLRGVTELRRAKMGRFLDRAGHIIVSRVRRAKPGVVKRYRERFRKIIGGGETPMVEVEREIELVDGLGAHALLGKFLGMEKGMGAPRPPINLRRVLRGLSDDALKPLASAARAEMERRNE